MDTSFRFPFNAAHLMYQSRLPELLDWSTLYRQAEDYHSRQQYREAEAVDSQAAAVKHRLSERYPNAEATMGGMC